MVFKKLFAALGVGGAKVETVLDSEEVVVGETLSGVIQIKGGDTEQRIDDIVLELFTKVEREYETSDGESRTVNSSFEIAEWRMGEGLVVAPGSSHEIEFSLEVPLHTPVVVPHGRVPVWLKTRLDIPKAIDASDTDPVRVLPNRKMIDVFEAMEMLGFRLAKSDVEARPHWFDGHGYVQEFEFKPATWENRRYDEVEIVFHAESPGDLELLIQVDRSARGFVGALLEATGHDESWHRLWVPDGGPEAVADALSEIL